MRILTYNIHGAMGTDGRRDHARISKLFETHQIDIALIQEMDTRPKRKHPAIDISVLAGQRLPFIAEGPTISTSLGWYGNAVLSRYPLKNTRIIDISHTGREPRNILETFAQTPFGTLHILNTHKGLKAVERGYQLKKLGELLALKSDIPLIVGGDLNEWHSASVALRKLEEFVSPLKCGASFPTRFPLFALDRMWCRPNGLLKNAFVLKTKETRVFSDHYPLMAELDESAMKDSV